MSPNRRALQSIANDLRQRLAAIREGSANPEGTISFGKRVGEGTSAAIERFADVAIHDQLSQQLAAVEAAITRIDDGSFGRCLNCGRSIAEARLEAIPWAATCVACA